MNMLVRRFMGKFILSIILSFISFLSIAQSEIVQGPFKIDDDGSVYIKREVDVNYPLGLYLDSNGNSSKVDDYEVDGDNPHVETVFFTKINNQKNVIILISWKQFHAAENINGTSYQVYAYTYYKRHLTLNATITNDDNLNGLDGEFNGEELFFKYKNASEIKKYLNSHYK